MKEDRDKIECVYCQACHRLVDKNWTEFLAGYGTTCIDCSEHIYEATLN